MLLASHTNQSTTAIYQVNKAKKDRERLKKLSINI
jgi:site-specific recombinase, phage integrase family